MKVTTVYIHNSLGGKNSNRILKEFTRVDFSTKLIIN